MPCTMALYTPDDRALLLDVTVLEHHQHLQHDNSAHVGQVKGQAATVMLQHFQRAVAITPNAGNSTAMGDSESAAHLRYSGLNDLGYRRDRLLGCCWVCRCHDGKGGDAYNCTEARPCDDRASRRANAAAVHIGQVWVKPTCDVALQTQAVAGHLRPDSSTTCKWEREAVFLGRWLKLPSV